MRMKEKGLLRDIRVMALIFFVLAALIVLYGYPPPPPDAGINGNLKYGLDLVGGSWLQLKLEGTLVGINAPVNESEVATFLENKLDAEVVYYKTDDVVEYEIRKSVSKANLSDVLREINGSIAKKPTGEDYFEEGVTPETRDETRQIIETKLNLLGLAGTNIRTVGNNFILVDLAGVDIGSAKSIVGRPGKFEIRIQTEGRGGEIEKGQGLDEIENITAHVMYGSEGIESRSVGAVPVREKENAPWGASFTLTEKGAVALRDAALTYGATDNPTDHELAMLLDDVVIYSAPLSSDLAQELKAKPVYGLRAETGLGTDGFERAKELIVHLKAGVLPVSVAIIGSGEVPAYLGAKFKEGALIAGLLALLFVTLVVFLRYREKKVAVPMFFTLLSEIILILGFAAVINWQLDLPSIAGIIAVIGTGVDQLVIITDEVLSGGRSSTSRYRKRISFAFGIIFVSATTTIVAMLALAFMALGTLRGFAIVTIVGLLIGIFITRPAYARVIETIV
jgi:preprotein translocase subunit SecD